MPLEYVLAFDSDENGVREWAGCAIVFGSINWRDPELVKWMKKQ